MSVVRQLLQISAVEAFRGATLAGDDVFDSRIDTLPNLLVDARRPVLIVSIESSEQAPDHGQGQYGLLGRDTRLSMMVQAAVASAVEIRDQDGDVVVAEIGETDAAFEATLNILDRQWRSVLQYGEGPWAKIWRGLVFRIGKVRDTRAVDPETGRKHAARFTELDLDVVWEPDTFAAIPDNIEAGLAAMEADGDVAYAEIARVFRALLTNSDEWPQWQQVQSALSLVDEGLQALGLGPLAGDEDRATPPFDAAIVEQEGMPPVTIEVD